MKPLITLFVLLDCLEIGMAQSWEWQLPLPTGNNLNSVEFVDVANGWAVGSGGTILRTTDGGSTWTAQTSGTINSLEGVAFADAANGWVVGGGGTILHTTNGGSTWAAQTSGGPWELSDADFVSSTNGWAVGAGGTILKTTNGGSTWNVQTSGTGNFLYDVAFADAARGWTVGSGGTILRTTNGGSTWTAQTSGTTNTLWGVAFVDVNNGWVVGNNGTILSTNNGGSTWIAQTSGTTDNLHAVAFVNASTGWAVGFYGVILQTGNGGITWIPQTSGTPNYLHGVKFADATNGWAVGNGGTIVHTANGGSTWTSQSLGTPVDLWGIAIVGTANGWTVGGVGVILHTTNGGSTWTAQSSGTSIDLWDVAFADTTHGWAVGYNIYGVGILMRTADGGTSWQSQINNWRLLGVMFADTSHGWAVGRSGTIVHTTNGGSSWTAQSSGTTSDLYGVDFAGGEDGWTVGSGGTILRTTNGGSTWTAQTSGTPASLYGVRFTSVTNGCVVGAGDMVLRTTNGGDTWTSQSFGSNTLYGVAFADANNVWITGDGGDILHSTNGGDTWDLQSSGTGNRLSDVAFANATSGWAVGEYGTILHYNSAQPVLTVQSPDGGETWTASETDTIRWTSQNLSENVKIELNRSYPGPTWETILASTANTGSYVWIVTVPPTTSARVRITGVVQTTVGDTSDADFTISGLSVPTPSEVTASDSLCSQVIISWTYGSNASLDRWVITRNDAPIDSFAHDGLPPGPRSFNLLNLPSERAQYCVRASSDALGWGTAGCDSGGTSGAECDTIGPGDFFVQGDMNVPAGDTLVILPGANLIFDGQYILTVNGVLIVIGTESDPVYFSGETQGRTAPWSGIQFVNAPAGSVLEHCVIENAQATGNGAGIFSLNSSPAITHCIIRNNSAEQDGGGIYCTGTSAPVISQCEIYGNTAVNGGGIALYQCSQNPSLTNCLIRDNTATARGGGVYLYGTPSANVHSCTVTGNTAGNGGGGADIETASPTIRNTIVSFSTGSEIHFRTGGQGAFDHCMFYHGGSSPFTGTVPAGLGVLSTINVNADSCDQFYNIFLNPWFTNAGSDDYHLADSSHCLGAGTPAGMPAVDIEGNPRPAPSGSSPDIGAYENPNGHPPLLIYPIDDLVIKITGSGNDVRLDWSRVQGATSYKVYAGTTPNFAADTSHYVGQTADSNYTHLGAVSGATIRFYVVLAHQDQTAPPGMVLIPAGPYDMGADYGGLPIHEVNVPAFYMDIYEVTNAQYKAFCDATGRAYPPNPGYYTNYFTNPTYTNYPVINVYWADASAYAAWVGKRLPSEAEWEKAAKGTVDNRLWPWGDTWVAGNANVGGGNADGYAYTAPVGSFPAGVSPMGCYDMAGNANEWCEDDWHGTYNGAPTDGSAWIDTPRANLRVMRGGSWSYGSEVARCVRRLNGGTNYRSNELGFRCAKTP